MSPAEKMNQHSSAKASWIFVWKTSLKLHISLNVQVRTNGAGEEKRMNGIRTFVFLLPLLLIITLIPTAVYAFPGTTVLRPNADGYETGWWASSSGLPGDYVAVQEETADAFDSYITSRVYDTRETFGLPDISTSDTVTKVTVYAMAMSGGHNMNLNIMIRTHDSEYLSEDFALPDLADDFALYSYEWINNPSTESGWTIAEVNALEAGVRHGFGSEEEHVTQIYVEVDIVPASVVPVVPLGTLTAAFSMIAVLAAYIGLRWRKIGHM
jgi:hypothetical protein